MSASTVPVRALDLAEHFRRARGSADAFALWRAANSEAEGHLQARMTLFRHAMIHAGLLLTKKGEPYKRCSMCHMKLGQ